jgi:hypothetical protein
LSKYKLIMITACMRSYALIVDNFVEVHVWFLLWKVQLVMVIILSYVATCNYICIKIALYSMVFSHTYWLYILKNSLCLCILKFWHVLYPCTDQQNSNKVQYNTRHSPLWNRLILQPNFKEINFEDLASV